MNDANDMTTPVTRGELRAELEQLEIRVDHKLERFEQRLERRFEELEVKLEQKLEEKLEQKLEEKLEKKLAHLATKTDLEIWGGALLERMMMELARHTKAIQEALLTQISVFDDKYADLPRRVSHLETTVFGPERR